MQEACSFRRHRMSSRIVPKQASHQLQRLLTMKWVYDFAFIEIGADDDSYKLLLVNGNIKIKLLQLLDNYFAP